MNFKSDLARGQAAEAVIAEKFPQLCRTNGRDVDFVSMSGQRVELKADNTTYRNFFMEIISNDNKRSPGGCFQSMFKKADYLLYFFEKTGELYCFRIADLIWFLYENKEKYALKKVNNRVYYTHGQAIPITDLQHLSLDPAKEFL